MFVTATYSLEGDGLLVVDVYEKIETVRAAIRAGNVNAVAQHLFNSSDRSLLQGVFRPSRSRGSTSTSQSLQQNIIQYAIACVHFFDYFNKMFDSNLKDTLMAFKAARYFSPLRLKNIQPDAQALNSVKAFPFLDSQMNLNRSFLLIKPKSWILILPLTFASGGIKVNMICHAGQLLLVKYFLSNHP